MSETKKLGRAEIFIEDTEDGQLAVRFNFAEGADINSNAHQVANLVRIYLDSIMVKAPDSDVVEVAAREKPAIELAS